MNITASNIGNLPFLNGPTGIRETRTATLIERLQEQEAQRKGGMSSEQLADYRSFAGDVSSDIEEISNLGGGAGISPITGLPKEKEMTAVRAAEILRDNFDYLDQIGGSKRSTRKIVTTDDLVKALKDPKISRELRAAIQYVLEHDEARNAMDNANDQGGVDGIFGIEDFNSYIKSNKKKVDPFKQPGPRPDNKFGLESGGQGLGETGESGDASASDEGSALGEASQTSTANKNSASSAMSVFGPSSDPAGYADAVALAEDLHNAVQSDDEDEVTRILVGKSNSDINNLKTAYGRRFGDLKQELSEQFGDEPLYAEFLLALLEGKKREGGLDFRQVAKDVDELSRASEGAEDWRHKKFIEFFSRSTPEHIRAVAQRLERDYGLNLDEIVDDGAGGGDFESALVAATPDDVRN